MNRRQARDQRSGARIGLLLFVALALLLLIAGGAAYINYAQQSDPQVTVQPGVTVRCASGTFSVVDSSTVSCGSTTTSSSTSTTSTSPTTVPPSTTTTTTPKPPSCSSSVGSTISGEQTKPFDGSTPANATTEAASATWRLNIVGDYAVTVTGSNANSCWEGGRILGTETNPLTAQDPWTTYHYRAGFRWYEPNFTLSNIESSYYGDALKPKNGATDWHVKRAFVAHAYDDCLENDYLNRGTLEHSLLNCYVGYSARPSSGQGTAPNGTVTFDHVAMRLDPQANVYKGSVPGTGGWFKLDPLSPPMRLLGSVFRADQLPNHQDLKPPANLTACTGNTVLWGGAGDFPERAAWKAACPDTQFIIGADARIAWDLYVAAWQAGTW